MMISGCFGLLDGFAYRMPAAREAVAGCIREPQARASNTSRRRVAVILRQAQDERRKG